jgi:hypothetical protein
MRFDRSLKANSASASALGRQRATPSDVFITPCAQKLESLAYMPCWITGTSRRELAVKGGCKLFTDRSLFASAGGDHFSSISPVFPIRSAVSEM